MAGINRDDVDFDFNNLKLEEDLWARQVRENNAQYGRTDLDRRCVPIDGDALIRERMDEPKVTKTLEMFYNDTEKAKDF